MMQQEQQVTQLVKQTLQKVGHIENARLVQLMPAIPKQKRPYWHKLLQGQISRQVAMATLMLLLLFGSWQWFNNDPSAGWLSPPTVVAATATMTQMPAATETQTMPTETAVANQPEPNIITTPAPPPTPIAAVMFNTN